MPKSYASPKVSAEWDDSFCFPYVNLYITIETMGIDRNCIKQTPMLFHPDAPVKTATGTIAIQVKDHNDHCPELTVTSQTMCVDENLVYVTAVDQDEFPNSYPFEFRVIPENKQKWTVEPFNSKSSFENPFFRLVSFNSFSVLVFHKVVKSCL